MVRPMAALTSYLLLVVALLPKPCDHINVCYEIINKNIAFIHGLKLWVIHEYITK